MKKVKNKTAKKQKTNLYETVMIDIRLSVPAKDVNTITDRAALLREVRDYAIDGLKDWGISVDKDASGINMTRETYIL